MKYQLRKILPSLLLLGCMVGSCKNEDFNIGGYLVDPHTRAVLTDTLRVKVSTLAGDSVITSNRGVVYAGHYNDPQIGAMTAQAYIEFERTQNNETSKLATYDSAVLVLRPNGSYYGDTTKLTTLQIYKMAYRIEMNDDGFLYSTSAGIPTDAQPLAEKTVRMKTGKKERFEIRLPDAFGEYLFQGIRYNEDYMNADNYLKTFPGLSVVGAPGSECVHGLNASDTTCMVRIYYHITTSYKEDKTMDFKVSNTSPKYYFRLQSVRLPDLQINSKDDPKPSSQTRNMGFVMSGAPLSVRIEFPSLNNLVKLSEIVMIKNAELIIYPIQYSYETVPLPPKLQLFIYDPTKGITEQQMYQNTDPLTGRRDTPDGSLSPNYRYVQHPYYSFNITDFISGQLGREGYNKHALTVAIPVDNYGEQVSLQRFVFGDQSYWYKNETQSNFNRIQLKVTYVTYNE